MTSNSNGPGGTAQTDDFDARMQEWKRADEDLDEARERLSSALLEGSHAALADELHREVLTRRAAADNLLASILQELKQRRGAGR